MITNRNRLLADSDREIFEKTLAASINKAISLSECAVKEKHARIVIIASHKEKSSSSYWHIVRKLPLQDNPLIAWKFCHVTHKLLRDGHNNVIKDSRPSLSFIKDLGKLWGHLREGYGILIASYTHLLHQKLLFHHKNPQIPGNLILDDELLGHICHNDINSYFELSVDMLDYMDCILQLQKFVFNSMDMSRSNSMTSSGQCRLAPLISCIQDSCQLYHFLVQILFKLHSSLPADTLDGHRERFYKQFNILKQFYANARNLQYFKNLIQIPDMPNSSPNFLRACELSSHVKPMALVPEPEDYGNEVENDEAVVSDLVDTAPSSKDNSELLAIQTLLYEKNLYIEKLENEVRELRKEIERIKREDGMVLESLHNQIKLLENEISVQRQISSTTTQENEILKTVLKERDEENSTITDAKFGIVEKLAKSNEDKFQKMKEVYGKLREEHVQLLRASSEVTKSQTSLKKENESLEDKYKNILQELEDCKLKICKTEEESRKCKLSFEELTSVLAINKSLKSEKEELETKLKRLEEEFENKNEKSETLKKEHNFIQEQLDQITKEKMECQKKFDQSEKVKSELETKLHEAQMKNAATNEDLNKYSTEQLHMVSSLQSSQQEILNLKTQLTSLKSNFDELTELQQNLASEKSELQKENDRNLNELKISNQSFLSEKMKAENLNVEVLKFQSKIKDSEEKFDNLQRDKTSLVDELKALQKNMDEKTAHLNILIEQHKQEIELKSQKEILKNNCVLEKLILACESMTSHSLSQVENVHFLTLQCAADCLLENISPTIESLQNLEQIIMNGADKPDSEILLNDLIKFSFHVSETMELVLATAHAASIEDGEEMLNFVHKIGELVKGLLNTIKPEYIIKEKYLDHSNLLKNLLELLFKQATGLLPKIEDIQAEKMDDLIEKEMRQTSEAIEQAALRIAKMLASSRSQQSGLQLEVNEKILDSCNSLMMKIRILIEKSKLLQKEIVSQGRGTNTIKDFYKKHHRWTEGLISAAKAVGFGANLLVDAADKVVSGKGKFEELVVCTQEISASTAQLVVASKVKAERGSENLCRLSEASKGVSEATGLVVASAKSGAERIEEIDIFDFSKLTLHQAKRKEMDSQVRVLELESLLEKERRKLAELRKTHYQMAGETES